MMAMASAAVRSKLLDPDAAAFYPSPATPTSPKTSAHLSACMSFSQQSQFHYLLPPYALPAPYVPPLFHHPAKGPSLETVEAATRTVKLSLLPKHIGEAAIRAEMEAFGGVRTVEMAKTTAGKTAIVHFYDLRSAQAAVAEVRKQRRRGAHLDLGGGGGGGEGGGVRRGLVSGQTVWAEFTPQAGPGNRGSMAVLDSDPSLSLPALKQLFEAFGAVREVKEATSKKLVEFFDTRDADRAFSELNARLVGGRRLLLEYTTKSGGRARPSWKERSSSHLCAPMPPRLQVRANLPRSPSSSIAASSGPAYGGGGGNCDRVKGVEEELIKRISHAYSEASNVDSCSIISNDYRCKSKPALLRSKKLQQQWTSEKNLIKNHPQNGGNGGGDDSRFLFKVEEGDHKSSSLGDSRTTLMIKNIPNKYSQKLLLNMLDSHCIKCNGQIIEEGDHEPYSAYDFVYLPIDFHNKCNVGYGFVNLTAAAAAFRLFKAFHDQQWKAFNSRKICQVTYARIQGLEALKEHFSKSNFPCDCDEYLPVVFSPPRDGKQHLTEPATIAVLSKPALETPATPSLLQVAVVVDCAGGALSTSTMSSHGPSSDSNTAENEDDDIDSTATVAQEEEEEETGAVAAEDRGRQTQH